MHVSRLDASLGVIYYLEGRYKVNSAEANLRVEETCLVCSLLLCGTPPLKSSLSSVHGVFTKTWSTHQRTPWSNCS